MNQLRTALLDTGLLGLLLGMAAIWLCSALGRWLSRSGKRTPRVQNPDTYCPDRESVDEPPPVVVGSR